jgi:hypothetical protein
MEYRPGSGYLASATPGVSADGSLLATPRSTGGGDVIEVALVKPASAPSRTSLKDMRTSCVRRP